MIGNKVGYNLTARRPINGKIDLAEWRETPNYNQPEQQANLELARCYTRSVC